MNIRNPFHVAAFFLLTSVALWVTLAVSQGFFLISVPQAPNYCKKWVLIPDDVDAPERVAGSPSRCAEFISTLERLKYYHNLRMVERNRVLLYTVAGAGFVLPFAIFYVLPQWRGTQYAHERDAVGIVLLGFLLAFSPVVLGTVLPSPSRWAPDWMNSYFESRRAEALVELTELAIELEILRAFRPAAEQGDADAQTALGGMYHLGLGTRQDYKEAVRWYRLAAEQGDAVAQHHLGLMSAKGQGVPQDDVQAHMWFSLAAAQGREDAREFRDILANKMTPAQLAKAERLAREWKATQ